MASLSPPLPVPGLGRSGLLAQAIEALVESLTIRKLSPARTKAYQADWPPSPGSSRTLTGRGWWTSCLGAQVGLVDVADPVALEALLDDRADVDRRGREAGGGTHVQGRPSGSAPDAAVNAATNLGSQVVETLVRWVQERKLENDFLDPTDSINRALQ